MNTFVLLPNVSQKKHVFLNTSCTCRLFLQNTNFHEFCFILFSFFIFCTYIDIKQYYKETFNTKSFTKVFSVCLCFLVFFCIIYLKLMVFSHAICTKTKRHVIIHFFLREKYKEVVFYGKKAKI